MTPRNPPPPPAAVSALDDDAEAYMEAARAAMTVAGRARAAMARASAVAPRHDEMVGRGFKLEHAGPGWLLWSAERFTIGDDPELHDPLGGVCVEVEHVRVTDYETGEVVPLTVYRCYSWRGLYCRLDAAEIDLAQLAGLDRMASTAAIRRLLRPVGVARGKSLRPGEVQAIEDARRLAVAIA